MLDPEEKARLLAWSAELASQVHPEWEPRAVTRAFATRPAGALVLTMQGWIDLEAARSPLLRGRLPGEEETDDVAAQLDAAAQAFGLAEMTITPEEGVALGRKMLRAVGRAFATALKMRHRDSTGGGDGDGFGDWLPVYACLVSQLGLSRAEARTCPVEEALALIATHRHNQPGWRVEGANYAQQDLEAEE